MNVHFEREDTAMTLTLRKIILLAIIGGVFLMANIMVVANWLTDTKVPQFAAHLQNHYLTGTAITVIIALLILLAAPKGDRKMFGISRTCPVCDKRLTDTGSYCSACGSKV